MPRQRLGARVNFTVGTLALVVTAFDAVTKAWARHSLAAHALHLGGAVWLRLQYNSGISFSIGGAGPLIPTVLTVLVAALVLIAGMMAHRGVAAVGFGLMLGGGVANVVDRLAATPHRVTDFIALGSLPVFNLADVAVTAGFVTLLVAALRGEKLLA